MQYIDITPEELDKLNDALPIIESLWRDDPRPLILFGLCKDPVVLDAAREAIADSLDQEGITEDTIQLSEIAVSIPLSSDVIRALTGSGIKLGEDDEFAYRGTGGEGIRTVPFNWANYKPQVTLRNFLSLAISNDTVWLEEYLGQVGSGAGAQINKQLQRTQPSSAPQTPTPAAIPGVPKQTSRKSSSIEPLLEKWLG